MPFLEDNSKINPAYHTKNIWVLTVSEGGRWIPGTFIVLFHDQLVKNFVVPQVVLDDLYQEVVCRWPWHLRLTLGVVTLLRRGQRKQPPEHLDHERLARKRRHVGRGNFIRQYNTMYMFIQLQYRTYTSLYCQATAWLYVVFLRFPLYISNGNTTSGACILKKS